MNFNMESKKSESLFLSKIKAHATWHTFFTENTFKMLRDIEKKLVEISSSSFSSITPQAQYVLRFLNIPASEIKVMVLGQDPYPQKGVATGRAFEVGNLHSWQDTFPNPSLKNIIRAIYQAYIGEIRKYSEIKQELGQSFLMLPPTQVFDDWERQGVLFLNTALTCTIDASNSHSQIWQGFMSTLLAFIAEQSPGAIWFLWGNNALEITRGLPIRNRLFTYHPSRCQPRDKDFLYGEVNCFAETKGIIEWARYKKC